MRTPHAYHAPCSAHSSSQQQQCAAGQVRAIFIKSRLAYGAPSCSRIFLFRQALPRLVGNGLREATRGPWREVRLVVYSARSSPRKTSRAAAASAAARAPRRPRGPLPRWPCAPPPPATAAGKGTARSCACACGLLSRLLLLLLLLLPSSAQLRDQRFQVLFDDLIRPWLWGGAFPCTGGYSPPPLDDEAPSLRLLKRWMSFVPSMMTLTSAGTCWLGPALRLDGESPSYQAIHWWSPCEPTHGQMVSPPRAHLSTAHLSAASSSASAAQSTSLQVAAGEPTELLSP